jgi:hypothetical protein
LDNWCVRPTSIDEWPTDIDYTIFIDENNDPNLKSIVNKINNNEEISNIERYFTITACVIGKGNFIAAKKNITQLKNNYWRDGKFTYSSKVKRVIFHSREIRNKAKAFSPRTINYNKFLDDLTDFISSTQMYIISSTIDKCAHCKKYNIPFHPYNLCLDFILERLVTCILNRENKKGIIILEARGKKEDKFILKHMKDTLNNGTYYVSTEKFQNISGVYFNPKWCKQSNEQMSYFGLEIADLVSYPIHKYIRDGHKDSAFESFENKFLGYPSYEGIGLKVFP